MAILAECPVCHTRQSKRNKKCIGWLDKKSDLKCMQNLDDAKKAKKVRYHITYRMSDGKQRWESVGAFEGLDPFSVSNAQNALAKRKVQKKERRLFDMLPDSNVTFSELIDWFLDLDKVKSKAYYKTLNSNLKHFKDIFGADLVSSLKPVDLENFQIKMKKADYSDSYIDSITEAAKNFIYKAFDNDKIGGECLKPFRKTKKLMRRAEMTKEGKAKIVPISKTLRSVLMQLPGRGNKGYVFAYGKKLIKDLRDGLKRACEKADIAYGRFTEGGFIFHDLGRTFVTNARKAAVTSNVTNRITGHSNRGNMNARYDQIDTADLLKAIDQIEDYIESVSKNVSNEQNRKSI